jgi:hypothetical protein
MNLTNVILPYSPTDDLMVQLLNYLQQLAQKHLYIQGYLLGERYEENTTTINYPLMQVILPLNSAFVSGNNLKTLSFSLSLRFTANGYIEFKQVSNGIEPIYKQISKFTEDSLDSTVGKTDQLQDLELNKLIITQQFNIANNIIAKISNDFDNGDSPFQLTSYRVNTFTRESNDDVNGVEVNLTLESINPYICGTDNYFTNVFN